MGAVHFLWLGACRSASPPFEEVGYAHVFEAASAGEQGVGIDFDQRRPAPLSRFRTMRLQALSRCRIRPAGRALDTPGSRHVPSVGRPSRKRARRISPVLSAPSIPRPALPNRRKSSRTHHRTGAGLEFRPCPEGTRLQADSRSAARGGLRGIRGRPGKSGRPPPGSLRPRIFGRTQLGSPPPRRRDGVASAGELGRGSGRHPIIHAKGLPYCRSAGLPVRDGPTRAPQA